MNYIAKFQPNKMKDELNKVGSSHFDRCNHELNEKGRTIMVMLSHYSNKFAGVTHLKSSTVEEVVK